MKKFIAIAALISIAQMAHCQLVLGPGDVYVNDFTSVPLVFVGSSIVPVGTPPSFGASFTLDSTSIQPGDSFAFDLISGGVPLVWQGPNSGQSLSAIGFGFPGIRFTGLSGSVTISEVSVWYNQLVSEPFGPPRLERYEASIVPVPEPAPAGLAALGAAVVFLWSSAHLLLEHAWLQRMGFLRKLRPFAPWLTHAGRSSAVDYFLLAQFRSGVLETIGSRAERQQSLGRWFPTISSSTHSRTTTGGGVFMRFVNVRPNPKASSFERARR